MGRIYSNYEEHELESVKKKAEELGFSASSFQNSLMDSVGEGEGGKIWEIELILFLLQTYRRKCWRH